MSLIRSLLKLKPQSSSAMLIRRFSGNTNMPIVSAENTEKAIQYLQALQTENEHLKTENAALKKNINLNISNTVDASICKNEKSSDVEFNTKFVEFFLYLLPSSPGDRAVIGKKLKENADPNFEYKNFTPLMYLVKRQFYCDAASKKITDLLLQYGANIDYQNGLYENTALHYAASMGKASWVEYLLEKKADANLKNAEDDTALQACQSSFKPVNSEIIDLLQNAQNKNDRRFSR